MPIIQESEAVEPILTRLRNQVRQGRSLQECCQNLMEAFHETFADSIVLARTYATIPFEKLPERDQDIIRSKMMEGPGPDLIRPETRVLSLLGTSGLRPEWRDRYLSSNHLAIPLVSEASVAEMPMVSNMIQQLGRSANWYRRVGGATLQKDDFGVFTDTFFVANAAISLDSSGRLMIPAQEFVTEYGIKTVLGVGGEFSREGIVVVCIFFTTEQLPGTPKWLLRVPLLLSGAAKPLVEQGKLFPANV